jgi:N-acetylglucosamine-6-phosphate deacetylase
MRVGLIADGVHVAPTAVRLAWRLFGPDRLVLVTDSVAAAPGTGEARTADGVLAGSLLTMDAAVRGLMSSTGCSLADAVAAASTVPAGLVGLPSSGVVPGAPADLVLLDAAGLPAVTVVGGRPVFDPHRRWS